MKLCFYVTIDYYDFMLQLNYNWFLLFTCKKWRSYFNIPPKRIILMTVIKAYLFKYDSVILWAVIRKLLWKKNFQKKLSKTHRKHLWWSSFFKKVTGNFKNIFRAVFLLNAFQPLVLHFFHSDKRKLVRVLNMYSSLQGHFLKAWSL